MSIVSITIEQNYNQIFVKKKDLPSFEKELNDFQKSGKILLIYLKVDFSM
jgi:hypothetical protein